MSDGIKTILEMPSEWFQFARDDSCKHPNVTLRPDESVACVDCLAPLGQLYRTTPTYSATMCMPEEAKE